MSGTFLERYGAGLAAAAIVSLPVLVGTLSLLTSEFLGIEYVDHYGTQWFYWFVEHQLRLGKGPTFTELYFYPYGKDIYLHTGANVLDAYLALPFRLLFGGVAGYNLFVLAGLLASGAAFWKLAGEFTEDGSARLTAAALVTMSPYVLIEVAEGRPTQAFLALPTLFLLFMWRSGLRAGWRAPVAAGLMLALCGLQYWYYAFFGGMICLAHGLWRTAWPAPDGGGRLRTLARHALIAAVALAICAPIALPLFMASAAGEVPGLVDVSSWTLREALPVTAEGESIALFLWQPLKDRSGFYALTDSGAVQFLQHGILTPTVAVAMAGLALLRPGRLHRGPLLAMFAMAALLAMGPLIVLGQGYLINPFYVFLAKSLGFMQRLWWPSRAYAFTQLLYGLTFAVALAWAGQQGRAWSAAAGVLASLLWVNHLGGQKLAPMPTWDAVIPAGYQCLAQGNGEAIIELPYSWTQAHLYYQTAHGRPILGGMLENNEVFTPPESVTLRTENTYVAGLLQASHVDLTSDDILYTDDDRQAVYDLGYRFIVLQNDAFWVGGTRPGLVDNAMRTRLRRMRRNLNGLAGEPIYQDARIQIHAPWGDPLPCDLGTITPDTEARGLPNDSAAQSRVRTTPGEANLRPILPVPPDMTSDAKTSDAKTSDAKTSGAESPELAPPVDGLPAGSPDEAPASP